jgi:N-acetylglutamate synthase-like GNAT family acetyltransferase
MDLASLRVRRATVDDLPQLIELWQIEQLPWQELEKRMTEFQVADDGVGQILGALGIQIAAHQGKIHSEVFRQAELSDILREKFWARIETLAHNHVLERLWTLETAPFWHGYGFHPPASEVRQKLPPAFGDPAAAWTVLSLRPEHAPVEVQKDVIEKEFNLFKEAERARTETALRQGRMIKTIATILAVLLFLGVVMGMTYLFIHSQQPPPAPK